MDSMQRLSTSLPRNREDQPVDLLTDFKAAARSVTDLYRTAATVQKQARAAGYQDALDDLLAMLDRENMGLGDGEGWRVRQWATERLDGDIAPPAQSGSAGTAMTDEDSEDRSVKEDDNEDTRSSSPELQRRPQLPIASSELADDTSAMSRRVVSEPPQAQPQDTVQRVPHGNFTFQSSLNYPVSNNDRDMEMDATTTSTPSSTETVRLIPRSARAGRHTTHNRRNGSSNRTPTLNFNVGSSTGGKRKLPYPDFFDISGINDDGDRRDNNGTGRGNKRRHV